MSGTITQDAVAKVSRDAFARHFKADGFKKKGNHLYRQHEDVFHGVQFQASHWNSSEHGKFTINLVVTSPSMFSLCLGKPFPSNPASADFPLTERIGLVMPPPRRDIWWEVSPETDLDALSADVCEKLVQYGLPFFAMYPNGLAILKRLRSSQPIPIHQFRPLVHAILAKEAGFGNEARQVLQQEIDWSQRQIDDTRKLADQLGLDLP
jgi:hypothetical protein